MAQPTTAPTPAPTTPVTGQVQLPATPSPSPAFDYGGAAWSAILSWGNCLSPWNWQELLTKGPVGCAADAATAAMQGGTSKEGPPWFIEVGLVLLAIGIIFIGIFSVVASPPAVVSVVSRGLSKVKG